MITNIIEKSILKVLQQLKIKPVKFTVEHPENMAWGDYSTNVGLVVGVKGVSFKICEALKAEESMKKIASEITVAGAGFINISIKNDALITQTERVLRGDWEKPLKGKKIMVEFAHPNTHKEMHIGHMRTLIVGEALAKILTGAGAEIFRANYQGDIGPHVAKSIWGTEKILKEKKLSWEQADKLSLTEKVHLLGEGYVRGNQEYETNQQIMDELNVKLYQHDQSVEKIYQLTRQWSLDYYDQFYQRFGTKFDQLFFESQVAEPGKKIVLKNVGQVFEKSQKAVVFKGEKYGLHTRVFVTQDGNPTYEAKDMALGPEQFKAFPFNQCIHVVANEQTGYFQVIIKALELIDKKFIGREYHLPMGMVNLIGKKISSRTGEIVTVDGLLDEVKELLKPLAKDEGVLEAVCLGVVKYSVLKTGCQQNVVFDIKQSVSIEGNSGPYLQYTYARCRSVLEKAGIQKGPALPFGKNGPLKPEEEILLRMLYRYEEIVIQAAEELAPSKICEFLYDLAQKYNSFYNKHRVIGNDFRLWLTSSTAEILNQGLDLLGISTPEKM